MGNKLQIFVNNFSQLQQYINFKRFFGNNIKAGVTNW
jgi:hypothetical protein